MNRRAVLRICLGVVLMLAMAVGAGCSKPTRMDPVALAASETRMWRAYYGHDRGTLGRELVRTLRTQYGLSWLEAYRAGRQFADAALAFRQSGTGYDRTVLPALVAAYRRVQVGAGASFDPEKAARAELDWWIARRQGGDKAAAQAVEAMASLYAVLYGGTSDAYLESARLRIEADRLRQAGGARADWPAIENTLRLSYEALSRAAPRVP